jgi:hypothetical protein
MRWDYRITSPLLIAVRSSRWLLGLLVLLTQLSGELAAQRCNGNLGENLFPDGDFGRGTFNIPQNDPGIAPGFTYVRVGPPNDGEYTITNNTGFWSQIWAPWLLTTDNSSDPTG